MYDVGSGASKCAEQIAIVDRVFADLLSEFNDLYIRNFDPTGETRIAVAHTYQLVHKLIGRFVDDVDDPVFHAADHESVDDVDNRFAVRHVASRESAREKRRGRSYR